MYVKNKSIDISPLTCLTKIILVENKHKPKKVKN